jgi:hypothetical protein
MGSAHPSPKQNGLLPELLSLLLSQRRNYEHYCNVLHLENTAIEDDDIEKMLEYQKLEGAAVAQIVNVEKSCAELEKHVSNTDPQKTLIKQGRVDIESLRQKALEENAFTRNLLNGHLKALENEITACGAKIRHMRGNKSPLAPEPRFIDIHS